MQKHTNLSISGSAYNAPKYTEIGVDKEWVIRLLRDFNLYIDKDYRNPTLYIYKDKELDDFLDKSEVWNGE